MGRFELRWPRFRLRHARIRKFGKLLFISKNKTRNKEFITRKETQENDVLEQVFVEYGRRKEQGTNTTYYQRPV
jgi:hypothetical protein